MNAPAADLVVRHLSKDYPSGDGTLPILKGLDLELSRGQSLAITGPSGSGKSTLLQILGVLDHPTAGEVLILGQNPFTLGDAEQAHFRNHHLGFIFQDHHLLPQCSVLENVLIPALAEKGIDGATEARAKQLLERVGLSERLGHRPAQLSGGERQRVAVCRALINEPALLLADEPTGNLDPRTAESVGRLLLDLSREQNTLLICVTHNPKFAAEFDHHRHLADGRLVDAKEVAPA